MDGKGWILKRVASLSSIRGCLGPIGRKKKEWWRLKYFCKLFDNVLFRRILFLFFVSFCPPLLGNFSSLKLKLSSLQFIIVDGFIYTNLWWLLLTEKTWNYYRPFIGENSRKMGQTFIIEISINAIVGRWIPCNNRMIYGGGQIKVQVYRQ